MSKRQAYRVAQLALWVCMACSCGRASKKSAEPIKVAAAADLVHAFGEIGKAFEQQTHRRVVFSFGSTGLLAKQVAEGGPFDLFAAANVSFADDLVRQGHCLASSKALYARGRLVVWTPKDASIAAPTTLADLVDKRFRRIAIANPEHAPYGKAAQQALSELGLWMAVQPKVAYGENVRQALQYAQTGNADAAIVAISVAKPTDGRWFEIDPNLHAPLDQALVVCKHGRNRRGGADFAAFVGSSQGRRIMRRHGFLLPGELAGEAQAGGR